ncbi:MAG TPA: sigma-54-dependent Fis family transcriptional regulator [Gammaproteobacteria bacterium]|nr:sigma-54-dependent Fis family transcriptional regulator [Gammaproteobacteria bacterium]
MPKTILVIEDDTILNKVLVQQLKDQKFTSHGVQSWKSAEVWLKKHEPDLIIIDGRLPDAKGEILIPELSAICPVIMLTAYGSVPQAVHAIRAGASDYLVKPVSQPELLLVVNRVLDNETLREDFKFCKQQLSQRQNKLLIGRSEALTEVNSLIDAVAPSDMTVLIHGESGVGKELVAHELHTRSLRAKNNFIALDCCTIQESLFESELFGHERGAFTGADRKKKGLIDAAEKGTLFLDEIGEIGPAIQAKLLRILEAGTFRRVGSTQDQSADVRIVAATNRDLEQMVQDGKFRQDLYYRLNAFTITVPPLRDRRDDIPDLVHHFMHHRGFSRRLNKHINVSTMRELVAYDWPGNVRELKNVVERAIILSRNLPEIRIQHLAFCSTKPENNRFGTHLDFHHEPSLEQLEKHYLQTLLEKYAGHRGKVASIMGISQRNIYRLIQKHGLKKQAAHSEEEKQV